MKLSRLILSTCRPRELAGFLSEFFDLEVQSEGDEFAMTFGEVVLSTKTSNLQHQSESILEFHLNSLDELNELWQKYQFTIYRHGESALKDAVAPTAGHGGTYFEAIDIDQRRWRFVWIDHD